MDTRIAQSPDGAQPSITTNKDTSHKEVSRSECQSTQDTAAGMPPNDSEHASSSSEPTHVKQPAEVYLVSSGHVNNVPDTVKQALAKFEPPSGY